MRVVERVLICIALFAAVCGTDAWSQTNPGARVEGINPDHGYVLRLVSGVLADARVYLWTVDSNTNDLLSNHTEFRSHLLPYRARFRFHVEGNALIVTMEELQSPGKNGTWARSLIPASAAQEKLVAQMVDRLNRAKQEVTPSQVSSGLPTRSPQELANRLALHNNVKALIFDSVPTRCADGLCAVKKDGLWGFVDYQGNLVLNFRFHSAEAPYFSHGVCLVQAADSDNREASGFVYVDKEGKLLFGGKIFQSARPFAEEFTIVNVSETQKSPGFSAVVDLQGRVLRIPSDVMLAENDFHDELIKSQRGGKFGFRNRDMHWVVQPVYNSAQSFREGIAWVTKQTPGGVDKWGGIDKQGAEIIPFLFSQRPEPFSDGLAMVSCTDGKYGYVDTTGNLVIPCQYSKAGRFDHGHALVVGPQPKLIDKHGAMIAEGNYVRLIPSLRDDGMYVFVEAYHGLIDGNGLLAVPPRFLDIGPFPTDDDPSSLAWATSPDCGGGKGCQGFINRHGDFVLIEERSKF